MSSTILTLNQVVLQWGASKHDATSSLHLVRCLRQSGCVVLQYVTFVAYYQIRTCNSTHGVCQILLLSHCSIDFTSAAVSSQLYALSATLSSTLWNYSNCYSECLATETLHTVCKRVMFKTHLVCKCFNGTAPGYLSELCVPVASASGHQHLRSASTGILQVPIARTMIGRQSFAVARPSLTISVEQSSCCSTETRDDIAHFQLTTEGLSVPQLMCWQTQGTFTTTWRCCDVSFLLT